MIGERIAIAAGGAIAGNGRIAAGAVAWRVRRAAAIPPPGVGFFCLEPVSHLTGAPNRGFLIDVLTPGRRFDWIGI